MAVNSTSRRTRRPRAGGAGPLRDPRLGVAEPPDRNRHGDLPRVDAQATTEPIRYAGGPDGAQASRSRGMAWRL